MKISQAVWTKEKGWVRDGSDINENPVQLVDMKRLVNRFLQDMQTVQEDRNIEISIGDMPDCKADPMMMRIVTDNLLSNAIKFTKNRPIDQISLGAVESGGEICYFVRDNGGGSNMQYSGKIFAVFQRLHRADEY